MFVRNCANVLIGFVSLSSVLCIGGAISFSTLLDVSDYKYVCTNCVYFFGYVFNCLLVCMSGMLVLLLNIVSFLCLGIPGWLYT